MAVVEATGTATATKSVVADAIRHAMVMAVQRAHRAGVTDPAVLRDRQLAARTHTKEQINALLKGTDL